MIHLNPIVALAFAVVGLIPMLLLPTPLVSLQPGTTVNMLGDDPGSTTPVKIIQVSGHDVFPTTGQLRFTTVGVVGNPQSHMNVAWTLANWWASTQRLIPMEVAYPPQLKTEEVNNYNRQMMSSSQTDAKVAALRALGVIPTTVNVTAVGQGMPAENVLQVGDRIVTVAGVAITYSSEVSRVIQQQPEGTPVSFEVIRTLMDKKTQRLRLEATPRRQNPNNKSEPLLLGIGLENRYPFQVEIHMSEDIGGPSAGTMMALSIYDELTPGALTGGRTIAGTGTIDEQGNVGEISGVEQKMAAAKRDGATVFLAPEGNCSAARAHLPDGLQLVKIRTLQEAIDSLNAITSGQGEVPTC